MRAYRIILTGTNESYLVTEKQKPTFEKIMEEGGNAVVKIGETSFRAREIKRIVPTNVDLQCCPDYFQEAVKQESDNEPQNRPSFKNLPTQWIILSNDYKTIYATNAARDTTGAITKMLLAKGDPNADNTLRFIVAKAHFLIGPNQEKQFYITREQLPEALKCFPDETSPVLVVRQVYKYGVPQWI